MKTPTATKRVIHYPICEGDKCTIKDPGTILQETVLIHSVASTDNVRAQTYCKIQRDEVVCFVLELNTHSFFLGRHFVRKRVCNDV